MSPAYSNAWWRFESAAGWLDWEAASACVRSDAASSTRPSLTGKASRLAARATAPGSSLSRAAWSDLDVLCLKAMQKEDEAVLRSLAQTIELKDPYTRGHCERVAEYALLIAEALNFSEKGRKEITYGSWLHDCGKIGVPEAILNFNGPINNSDFDTVKKHPEWGAEVAGHANLSEVITNIILYHHERYDGSGYPMGLKGREISIGARIINLADAYYAMTTDRPYRKAATRDKAIAEIMKSAGGQFVAELKVNRSGFVVDYPGIWQAEVTSP